MASPAAPPSPSLHLDPALVDPTLSGHLLHSAAATSPGPATATVTTLLDEAAIVSAAVASFAADVAPTVDPLDATTTTAAAAAAAAAAVDGEKGKGKKYPDGTPRLAKSKVQQCLALRDASEKVLNVIWDMISDEQHGADVPTFTISRSLDRMFGELHALASQYKLETKSMLWPHEIPLKSIRENFLAGPGHAYFSIKKANIAILSEHILYAMPEEDSYGRNDIVFACEGFLPLVPNKFHLIEEETWKLFNELKMQIYIQRLESLGQLETDTQVLPNLFAESLASYSGQEVSNEIDSEFEKLGQQTHAEIIVAQGNLEKLKLDHPYHKFARWMFKYLHSIYVELDEEQKTWNFLHSEEDEILQQQQKQQQHQLTKQIKKNKKLKRLKGLAGLVDGSNHHFSISLTNNVVGVGQTELDLSSTALEGDISVGQLDQIDSQDFEGAGKPRFNPYKLGRGKGSEAAPRRRWTQEEHDILLEEVRIHSNKYDCMAQIIKRHGKDGEISHVLQEQNNVSLKDKARNLTMEWSKHGYPEDKPWLEEAFARFAAKSKNSTLQA